MVHTKAVFIREEAGKLNMPEALTSVYFQYETALPALH